MDTIGTILAIILILALVAAAVFYLWKSRNKGKPKYMVTPKAPKMTKEEKAAAKQAKASEKTKKKEKSKA